VSEYDKFVLCALIRSQVGGLLTSLTKLVEEPFLVDNLHRTLIKARIALFEAKEHLDKVVD